jgi:ABC-2 type transport system ATP-binding protein
VSQIADRALEMTTPVIEVERVSKAYGTQFALSDITFRVSSGTVLGLLGRNGAGKTTTLRILAGVTRPTTGSVSIDGINGPQSSVQLRGSLGYLPESAPLYPELRVAEHLVFRAALKGIPRRKRHEQVKRALSRVGAWQLRDRCCAHLSRGMRQRVGLADAILAEPKVLLLDEPTAGLDPNQTRETRELIRSLRPTSTVVVSTHLLAEVDALCDSAIVIDYGRIVAEGTLPELYAMGRSTELVLTMRSSAERARSVLEDGFATHVVVESLEPGIVRAVVGCPPDTGVEYFAERVTLAITSQGIPLREVTKRTPSLEQIFAELTAHEEQA